MDMLTGRFTATNNRCANRTIGTGLGAMALGLRRTNTGTLHHRGSHDGYRAYIFARPGNSWALALRMTGDPLEGSDRWSLAISERFIYY
jgi:hypothetical protein